MAKRRKRKQRQPKIIYLYLAKDEYGNFIALKDEPAIYTPGDEQFQDDDGNCLHIDIFCETSFVKYLGKAFATMKKFQYVKIKILRDAKGFMVEKAGRVKTAQTIY